MRHIVPTTVLISIFCFLSPVLVTAQNSTVDVKRVDITDTWRVNTRDFDPANVTIRHLEAPFPSGKGQKAELARLKAESASLYPRKEGVELHTATRGSNDSLAVADSFAARFFVNDAFLTGGTPNDNTLAISNDGNLIVAWNTQLWGYDLINDTFLFNPSNPHPSLLNFVATYPDSGLMLSDAFDPKLFYDPHADRFFMMFLSGRDSNTSASILAFSATNYPSGNWYAYKLSGNPLNDGTWTDFPQIAFNEHSMYLTLNQLSGGDWVTDFDQTVIWQIDLEAAYAGASTLPTKVISDIGYGGQPLRYLCPVKAANGPSGDDMFFISNRPRALSNDSLWLVRVTGKVGEATATDIKLVKSDVNYGLPPYAQQPGGHTFWTNDARALTAVRIQDEIQFVGNSIDHGTGKAAIFHGIIANAYSPTVKGHIISHPAIEFGFPNIEWVGTSPKRRDFVINFNHTSPTHPAGNAAIFFNTEHEYGPIQLLKRGNTYVDMIPQSFDPNERWGDYIGLQRKYNELNTVWAAGYFGHGSKRAGTWVSKLIVPMELDSITQNGVTIYVINGDTFERIHGNYYPLGAENPVAAKARIFPNPALEYLTFEFHNPSKDLVRVEILDVNGKLHTPLLHARVSEGKNVLRFNIAHMPAGVYVVEAKTGNGVLLREKFVKE